MGLKIYNILIVNAAMPDIYFISKFIHDRNWIGCSAVNVILRPVDTARELGKNVTLACIVTDKASSESVQWKYKPAGSDAFNALTFNENVLSSPSKYSIQWTYNLTVYNLQPEDAGLYRCTAGGVDYDATLVVVDLPQNVTIEMVGQPNNGETHNLTCKATNGLPPPTIRWLINGVDMQQQCRLHKKIFDTPVRNRLRRCDELPVIAT
ncbi:V-set and immunoglobulin domain-containing protein 1-like [Mercenaria mercenaria]|uniref:V-set and immunoglobulin domain-containing protein 1-like n=1 Tax=Mercenaria mercenaria TaxID=6596 RepID=UPI00234EFA10|nr:V-set and immunoglobulin domain-containing protein 1-like [Mercenaria mercenaria]